MKTNRLASLITLAMLGALVAYFPPGQFTWRTFVLDPSSTSLKLMYLGKVYLVPAVLAFVAIVGFRVQMGIAVTGVASGSVFPLALLSSGAMMAALRSMSVGIGGVPGYALGMAVGYTLMSKIYGLKKSDQTVFGRPVVKLVWRKDLEAARTAPRSSAAA